MVTTPKTVAEEAIRHAKAAMRVAKAAGKQGNCPDLVDEVKVEVDRVRAAAALVKGASRADAAAASTAREAGLRAMHLADALARRSWSPE